MKRFRSMGCEVVAEGGDVKDLFDAADRRFTRFRDDSELAWVNRADGPVLVSEEFARAVRAALRAARVTDGLVTPTLLDALEAAGYDRDFDALEDGPLAQPPAPGGNLTLTGRLLRRGARLDLNGVVKALAVDDALAAIGEGWVSAGGDLATSRPLEVALPGGGSIRLVSGALATSGSATRRWRRDGKLQHHLIDPQTRQPAESPWEYVTACGATCVDADIAAKAAFLLGDEGPAWLDARGMAGRFVRLDGSVVTNEAWAACT